MKSIHLDVKKAYPNDSGRGIARLDPDALLHLKLSPGDIIKIEGKTSTVAKVWRADREDWNTDSIRIDGFLRRNAGVHIGQKVEIRRVNDRFMKEMTLAPPKEATVQFGSDAAGMVKRQILKRPIWKWDIVPIMSSTNHPFMREPGQAIPLVATETNPSDFGIINEDTDVLLTEKIRLQDQGVANAIHPERPEQDPDVTVDSVKTEVPDGVCGYQRLTKPLIPEGKGNLCCARQLWKGGQCVWHTERGKPPEGNGDSEVTTSEPVTKSESKPGEAGRLVESETSKFKELPFQDAIRRSRNTFPERFDAVKLANTTIPEDMSFNECYITVGEMNGVEITNTNFVEATISHTDLSDADIRDADFDHAEFRSSYLERANLIDSNLREADIIESYVTGASFSGSRLHESNLREIQGNECDFSDAKLREADIIDSDLQSADFTEAELRNTSFQRTNLTDSNFAGADLRNADFSSANVSGAELSDANYIPRANLRDALNLAEAELAGADLTEINLSKIELEGANLQDARLEDSVLRGINLSNADLKGANLENSKVQCANLSGANLEGANLTNADLRFANLEGAQLGDAELVGANLSESELAGAEIVEAVLEDAKLIDTNLTDADLTDTNARFANFGYAELEQALMARTDLRGANLENARLYQTLFPDTRIDDRTIFGDKSIYEEGTVPNNGTVAPEEAATWVYRRLESLHDENAMADKARELHFRKEELQRAARFRSGNYLRWIVDTINRWLTGHGESLKNIIAASIIVILICGFLYPFTGGITRAGTDGTTLKMESVSHIFTQYGVNVLIESLYFSIITFTTVGYGDLFPASLGTKVLVGFESLLGALFIALFVFVLGRRVSR